MPYVLVTICCAFAALGSFLFGYDCGIISSSIAQDDFVQRFKGQLNDASTGGIVSSFTGGAIVGSLGVSYLSDLHGRRMVIFVGGILGTLGACLQAAASTIAMLIVGRFTAGVAVGIMSATIPVYCSEIAPPSIRGLLGGMQQWMIGWGFFIAQWVGFGSSHARYSFSWRFPLSLQAFPALLLVVGALFLPESPRWLIEHGQSQRGYDTLVRLHSTRAHSNASLIQQENKQICETISIEQRESSKSWRDILLKNPSWRRRILLAAGIQAFTQCSGVNVIQFYGPRLYATLGFSTSRSLMIIGISGALAQTWNTLCLFLLDQVGRRKLLIPSLLGMGATLCVEATLSHYFDPDSSTNAHALRSAVAMYFVFSLFFTPLGVLSWIYPAEIFSTPIRARGTSVSTFVNWSFNLLFAQCAPIGLSRLEYRFFYFFMAFNWVGAAMVWLWYPETVGKTLEEVEDVFRDGNLTSRVTGVANGLTPGNSDGEEASVSPAGGSVQETKGTV
ncbi:sugar transporter [Histoplasma ohiense]|nr:sugar transporter [Histoplasma ohiense (nom. inval.)]